SSTMIPKPPRQVVIDVDAITPAITHESVKNRATKSENPLAISITNVPRNKTYKKIIIKTPSKEKKTAALSRKKSFKLRITMAFNIYLISLPVI
ncbi:MAG TPA: hypothetical protein GX394_07820, partial [Clostridiales bacterium]|nr:hypothetical protein [Clostridiales bacterium]